MKTENKRFNIGSRTIIAKTRKTLIVKFGGAAVQKPECFSHIADLIIKRSEQYPQIVIVLSAMGDMTDQLVALARQIHPNPPRREYDMLVSVGERISISLLAMAFAKKGKKAVSFTGSQSGIITTNNHSEAKIIDVRPRRLLFSLKSGQLVIVAGFQGVSHEKEITTLGRGGSDTTAVALGVALGAEKIEFYKDVEGIFNEDPKTSNRSSLLHHLTYEEAKKIIARSGGQVLHTRAIDLAKKNSLSLHIRSFHVMNGKGTLISHSNPQPKRAIYES